MSTPDVALAPGGAKPPWGDNSRENDAPEEEARDSLGLQLVLAAEQMASACMAARGKDDSQAAENYAQAAHKLTQAVVLLTPITAADDIVNGSTDPGTVAQASQKSTLRTRTDQ